MSAKRVLVTGSGRGIGREFVRQYAESGYEVVATCRDPADAPDLASPGPGVTVERLDVRSASDLDALAARLHATPVDILVGNAAVFGGERSRLGDVDWDAWRTALEVNVVGAIRVAMKLWPNVAESEERKIVFLGSRAGLPRELGANRSYIYTSSKAALNSAARSLALDLVGHGVIVAVVNPGHVRSTIGGANAPMSAADSVAMMRAVIAGLTPERTGRFWHYDGSELPL